MHPAWPILFNDPEFWSRLDLCSLCCLRLASKEICESIPDRDAILGVFGQRPISARLFRLLPISVRDVLPLLHPQSRSFDALLVAERRAGGFANCMAIVRDRGWRLWPVGQACCSEERL